MIAILVVCSFQWPNKVNTIQCLFLVAELNEPTAVQRHEDEKHPSVVHIETNVNSAYGIHQENGVTAVQTDENQVHIETGINPAYGLHQGNGICNCVLDFTHVK